MEKTTLFILGDSTSMTVGCEREMYPFIMADQESWPDSTEIINCSQPGFTSADACAFFFRHWKKFPGLKAVVIHIGTCDSTSWEIHKGKYTKRKETVIRLRGAFRGTKERTRLKNRLLHYEWNCHFDPAIESPESSEDYEFNLIRVVEACVKSSVDVVLIRPRANNAFVPGVGKGNFVFYRYLGIREKIADRLSIADDRFREALRLHESGDFSAALSKYKEILLNSGPLSSSGEYPLIVANNYAVCAGEKGDLQEAEYVLQLLLKERGARQEIILFNLAGVYRMLGDEEKHQRYMFESREADCSMYRIRSPYLEAIDRVSEQFKRNIRVVDMASLVEDNLYVDHTHPLKVGQERIAGRVIDCLQDLGLEGKTPAVIQNILYNPELALGNTIDFFTYFRTQAPFTEEEISGFVENLKKSLTADESQEKESVSLGGFPKEIQTALGYHLRHPCFPSLRFLLRFGPSHPIDVGRFPEFFLVRYMFPYLRFLENEPALYGYFASGLNILRKSKDLLAILPSELHTLIATEDPPFDHSFEIIRLPAILSACRHLLLSHLRQGNQIYERMKTTIFWYFRETLRYGSHSRFSMRYDRTSLEYIAEALSVALFLNRKLNGDRETQIVALIGSLEETTRLHDHFSQEFTMGNHSKELLDEYDRRLFEVACRLGKE